MHKAVLGPDRVLLLLSLVPYLREHGPTSVSELAEAFEVSPNLLRTLVRFLGTAGVPGETLTYQDEDLFDIDWDALERDDVVSLTRTVAVEDAPRFAPAETAALIAGLHALTAVLPEADAQLARATAEKLGAALGVPDRGAALSVTADHADPRLPVLVSAIEEGRVVAFEYRDASGTRTSRTADPISLDQEGGTWYLRAHCHDRDAARTFRLDHLSDLRVLAARASEHTPEEPGDVRTFQLIASLPLRSLGRIDGFGPEVLDEDGAGRVRVQIEAWHEQTAIQLVQLAPGEIVIESPERARRAVTEWAARGLAGYDA
ncbi:WYL domain-containing protein [Leucobacter rhizosphaerae]|uniref:WYL domain-containing protein n=1 Tax=Leucobacter rhizosphaerae TaxID=2932245 RepID=A0ABY4FXI3_9MICO|nr:WYL domain-containing protein [Leucobacter rhizosphaerae]UOQ61011.1 WYL domain-containing protein [Leucobacter rhizosphaerae]